MNPSPFHKKCWVVTGAHPFAVNGTSFQLVQQRHQLYTEDHPQHPDQVTVLICDSHAPESRYQAPPVVLRHLGQFQFERQANVITAEKVIEGKLCHLEMRISSRRRASMDQLVLFGAIFNLGLDSGDDDAAGGWSAEAQGGPGDCDDPEA